MKLRLFTRMLAGMALTISSSATVIQPSYALCGSSVRKRN